MPSNFWRILFLSLLCPLAFPNKVIIFLTEDIELGDINRPDLPAFFYLKQHANWGLVSTRRSKLEEIIGGISAGNYPLVRGADAPLGFNAREKVGGIEAKYILYTRTGVMPSDGNIVQIAIEAMKSLNLKKKTGANIGLLGSLLRANGLKTAVLGNSDVEMPRRLGVLLACDENGIVDEGNVGDELLKIEPLSVAGKVIDIEKFKKELGRLSSASLIVIDSGEMGRYALMEQYLSPLVRLYWREDSLRRVDSLLRKTLNIYRKGDLFIFLSLIGIRKDKPDRLSPIAILWQEKEGKILSSPSTRWAGLVHLPDITATILDFFHLFPQTSVYGTRIKMVEGNWEELPQLAQLAALNGVAQPYLLILFLSIFLIGFFLTLYLGNSSLLLFSLLFPIAFYFAPFFHPPNLLSYPLVSFLLNLLLYLFLWSLSRLIRFSFIKSVIILIPALILADALSGGKLSLNSPLAVYALGGCRFYGVGNEFGGILLSTLPFALSYISQSELLLFIGVLISAMAMGLPFFGVNIGVSLSLFLLFLLLIYYKKGRSGLLIALSLIIPSVLFISAISYFSGSHLSSFMRLVMQDHTQSIYLLYNKLTLNFSIASDTSWKAGIMVLAGLFLLAFMKGLRVKKEDLSLFIPTLFSIVFAFFLNDTGAILVLFALLYLLSIFILKGYENIRS